MHDTELFEQLPFGKINDYTNSFHTDETDAPLEALRQRAEAEHVSVVAPNGASMLRALVSMHKPKLILELGTAFGVSTYHMKKAQPKDGKLITLELVSERQETAKAFLKEEGYGEEDITFICGDFRDDALFRSLHDEHGAFDFVFIDAAKGQYAHLLEVILSLLNKNGVVVFDNVFLNGWLIRDEYPNHRQKTAFVRMKKFLDDVKYDERFTHTLLPFDDGMLILVKK